MEFRGVTGYRKLGGQVAPRTPPLSGDAFYSAKICPQNLPTRQLRPWIFKSGDTMNVFIGNVSILKWNDGKLQSLVNLGFQSAF